MQAFGLIAAMPLGAVGVGLLPGCAPAPPPQPLDFLDQLGACRAT